MTVPDWLFDGALALALPILASCLVFARSLRVALMLFIAFGLLSALAWAELEAVDVALVEAALGTGLTGALLLSSLTWAETDSPPRAPSGLRRMAFALVLVGGLFLAAWSVRDLEATVGGLDERVLANMEQSGVRHPVTAVLLNFRGYDTLLEVAVLLVAAVAVRSIQPAGARCEASLAPDLLSSFVSLLVPVSVLVAGYIVWRGSDAPGGAFQAASISTGCVLVLVLSGRAGAPGAALSTRALLTIGPGLFAVIASLALFDDGHLLEYPRAWAGTSMLVIEIALVISIAVILTIFFPAPSRGQRVRKSQPG